MNAITETNAQILVDALSQIAKSAAAKETLAILDNMNMGAIIARIDDLSAMVKKVEQLSDDDSVEDNMRRAIDGFELISQEALDNAVRQIERNIEDSDYCPRDEVLEALAEERGFADAIKEVIEEEFEFVGKSDLDKLERQIERAGENVASAEQLAKNSQQAIDVGLRVDALKDAVDYLDASQASQATQMAEVVTRLRDLEDKPADTNETWLVVLERTMMQQLEFTSKLSNRITALEQDRELLKQSLAEARQALMNYTIRN